MTKRGRRWAMAVAAVPMMLLTAPLRAQDAPDYAPVQTGYDTDGQSVDSVAVFFEPLSHYGRWLDTRYGRAWAPNVGRDWRPYTLGHWDEGTYGQTWRSDEPFGWAVYHFGRWAFDPAIGWLWLPDTVWGPGWVAWRDSDDVTGWAPLPPQVNVELAVDGVGFNDWSYDQWYQPGWVYVPRGYLYSRSLRGAYLSHARNRDLWEHTRGVTRYERVDGQFVNRSFGDRRDARGDDRRGGDRGGRGGDFRHDGGDRRDGGDHRDGGRSDMRGVPPYAGQRPGTVAAPPLSGLPRGGTTGTSGGIPAGRGFDRRDGFVAGQPPSRSFDRRPSMPPGGMMPSGGVMPTRPPGGSVPSRPISGLAPPAGVRPMMPAPVAAPRPAPAPAPAPRPRESPGERPH